jgi:hypothetical protein
MKVVALAALSVLIALPAEAAQRQRQGVSPPPACDNNGHCTTFDAAAKPAGVLRSQPDGQTIVVAPPRQATRALDANGNRTVGVVISLKTGAQARVGISYAARFQAYIDDLENNHGARVLFMNGIRPGHCSPASEHPCGKALDVCQRRRGVVDPRCNLPARAALGRIAASHGLFEGGRWCNSDYGHAQTDVTAAACSDKIRIVRQ